MKRILAYAFIAMSLCSCQRSCQKMNKQWQTTAREYEVVVFSGGDTVFHDKFKGIINDSEGSDGMYYYKSDTLVEISGDYIIKSDK